MIRRRLIRKRKKPKEIIVIKKSANFWKYDKFNLRKTDESTTNSIKQIFSLFLAHMPNDPKTKTPKEMVVKKK